MARKAKPKKASPDKIITVTLKLAAARPWPEITMADIAEAVKLKPEELKQHFTSKLAILDGFNRQIDDQVAAAFGEASENETVRDQLFDILMSRFDTLQPHKESIKAILRETVPFDPKASLCGLSAVMRSMGSALNLLGIKSKTPLGCIKTKALAAVYLRSFKIWLEDDSADMAKTMAILDDGLAKIENLAQIFPRSKKYNQPKAA
jgi:AcrR family transcriptional regulator|tara:strand:+ start:3373 stop:3990 length:618 start_codon:yes stop_codon:yes gene_type:complete